MDQGRLPILVTRTVTSAEEVRDPAALGVAGYVNEYSAVPHMLPSIAPHLFPDNFNRRGSPRVVLGIPIACRVGKTISAALTLSKSRRDRDSHDQSAGTQRATPPALPFAWFEERHRR
jgi:hypothetical protein